MEHIKQLYADHVAHQQQAWEVALEQEGFDSAVIHSGSHIVSFLDDYHYPFRPNPHFLSWLPLTHHDECVLMIQPGRKPVLYFYQPDDYWHMPPPDPEAWWADHFEIRIERESGEWHQGIPLGREAYIGDAPELDGEGDHNPGNLINRLHLLRTVKTEYEIACLSAANQLAVAGHEAAKQAFENGSSEYDIHLAYLKATQTNDAQLPYGSIVALNEHAAVLHYQTQDREVPESIRTFLIDAGAAHLGYCSDITRTYCADPGDFAELISAMDTLQQDLCSKMVAGRDYRDLHLEAHHAIARVLVDARILKCDAEAAVERGVSSVFFPHGLGHYLGLQTHDVAGLIEDETGHQIPRPKGHPNLRLTRVLEAGNVVTVEPGLYFIDSLLDQCRRSANAQWVNWERVEEFRPYGGIRIEDNVVVTEDGPRNLSRDAFAAV